MPQTVHHNPLPPPLHLVGAQNTFHERYVYCLHAYRLSGGHQGWMVAVEKNETGVNFLLNDLAYLLNLYQINVITCNKTVTF